MSYFSQMCGVSYTSDSATKLPWCRVDANKCSSIDGTTSYGPWKYCHGIEHKQAKNGVWQVTPVSQATHKKYEFYVQVTDNSNSNSAFLGPYTLNVGCT